MSSLDLLLDTRAMRPYVAVIIITAIGKWSTWMRAMDCGWLDYLNKPGRRDDILLKNHRSIEGIDILALLRPAAGRCFAKSSSSGPAVFLLPSC